MDSVVKYYLGFMLLLTLVAGVISYSMDNNKVKCKKAFSLSSKTVEEINEICR